MEFLPRHYQNQKRITNPLRKQNTNKNLLFVLHDGSSKINFSCQRISNKNKVIKQIFLAPTIKIEMYRKFRKKTQLKT